MPTILAIDTSTDVCSIALATGMDISTTVSAIPRNHTQRVLPMVEELMAEHALSLCDLEAIAFGCGPGSFTGLRICLSFAQGLAYGADLPLVPISSLQAMARGAARQYSLIKNNLIIPVIDARMNEIYWSAYRVDNHSNSIVTATTEEQVCSPIQCRNSIIALAPTADSICAVGSGWHYSDLQSLPMVNTVEQDFYPSAYDVATLGLEAYGRGEYINALEAQPRYLRNEINWQKRKRIRE